MPKFSTTLLLCVSALVVGFCLGLGFRGVKAGKTEAVSQASHITVPADRPVDAPLAVTPVAKDAPEVSAWERLQRCSANEAALDLLGCLRLIDELSLAQCRKAWDLFLRWPQGERSVLRRAIARRWATLDAENALQALSTTRDWEMWELLGSETGRVLVQRDPEAALAKLARGNIYPLLVRHVLTALAETSPARAGAFLLTRAQYARDEDTFGLVGERWAKTDPDAALAWASVIPRGRTRNKVLQAVWTTWAERDPATVAGLLLQGNGPRGEGRSGFDATAGQVFGTVARAWSKADPGAASAWIASLPRQEDRAAAWASFDLDVHQLGGERAMELLQQVPPGKTRGEIIARITKDLARDDPQAALAWAERLPEGEARNQALRPALAEWAMREPTRAVAYIAGLPAGGPRTDLLREAVANWVIQDPEAAFQWSRSLPAGAERDAVIAASASRDSSDPARAVQWLELVQQPEKRQQIVQDLTGHWARLDGAAAADWLSKLPDAEAQVGGHYQLAREWAFEDWDATARWMGSLPPGPARNAAIGAFVDSVDGYDPALATAWATAIESPTDRDKTIRHAFHRWLERDGTSAWTWLHGADLSESLRSELMRSSEERLLRQGATPNR